MKLYTQADAQLAFGISEVELFTQNPEKKLHFQSTGIKHNAKRKPN